MALKFTTLLIFFMFTQPSFAFDHTHAKWTAFLQKNVVTSKGGSVSKVKYGTLNVGELKSYTDSLLSVSQAEVNKWTREQQLAFYFNLYNALTIQWVKQHYPISSITKIASFFERARKITAWKKPFFTLFGKKSYLDRIEHEIVRADARFSEPRVHFAFNCASIGCPALGPKAFVATELEAQLDRSLELFLSDSDRNYYKNGTLYISKIFYWYKEDFEKGHQGFSSVKDVFAKYAHLFSKDPKVVQAIREKKVPISILDYNWNLNKAG